VRFLSVKNENNLAFEGKIQSNSKDGQWPETNDNGMRCSLLYVKLNVGENKIRVAACAQNLHIGKMDGEVCRLRKTCGARPGAFPKPTPMAFTILVSQNQTPSFRRMPWLRHNEMRWADWRRNV
jgi:hypothetical protein